MAAVAAWVFAATGALEAVDLRLYDRWVVWAGADAADSGRVALVEIGEEDFGRYGYPLPDSTLAAALDRLTRLRARTIGVDLYRPEPIGSKDDPEEDARDGWNALEAISQRNPAIVFVEKWPARDQPAVPAPRFASRDSQVGFSDLVLDPGQVVRRGLLMLWHEDGSSGFSLALQLARHYLAAEGMGLGADPANPDYLALGDTALPAFEPNDGGYVRTDAGGYQILLDYRGGSGAFDVVPFGDLVEGRADQRLAGRVVLVGTASASVKDDFQTPYSLGAAAAPVVKGLEIHAHAVDQLLRAALDGSVPTAPVAAGFEMLAPLLAALLCALLAQRLRSWPLQLAAGLGGVIGVGLLGAAFYVRGLWLPVAASMLAWVTAAALVITYSLARERAEKREVFALFGRFQSRAVADALWERRDDFMVGHRPLPQRLMATVLMSDIEGYTAAAESLEPGVLLDWVNGYMDAITREVEAHGGFLDDYAGDGVKANFGVPVASTSEEAIARDARQAVACAFAVGRRIEAINEDVRRAGLPTVRMRVGIYTGPVVAGALGSPERSKYTTLGDTVNTASRLESFDKKSFADEKDEILRVLVGDHTREYLDGTFQVESLGEHALRGKRLSTGVFRVRAAPSDLSTGEQT